MFVDGLFNGLSTEDKSFLKLFLQGIIMFRWFSRKKEVEEVKEETRKGFDSVKKDIDSVGKWIKHLDSEKEFQKEEISEIKDILSSIHEEVEGLKNVVGIMTEVNPRSKFAKNQQVFKQQTAVYAVQTGVQTGVQTPKLDSFSMTERAILWVLLNTDLKLSYDDIAAVLGKERSTIRGQLNTIKAKSEGLISETIEKNGKKRVFIPENMREMLLKKQKVRVKSLKKMKKPVKKMKKVEVKTDK